jgi:hypothetical protein
LGVVAYLVHGLEVPVDEGLRLVAHVHAVVRVGDAQDRLCTHTHTCKQSLSIVVPLADRQGVHACTENGQWMV